MSKSSKKDNDILSVDLIAQYFIWKAQKEKNELTNKKLQKLLYYAQAWNLVFKDKPLFKEKIEAWVHGPAVRSIYNKYMRYGFNSISESGKDIPTKKGLTKFLDNVWKVYGKFDGDYLEDLTHNEYPWQEARRGLEESEPSSRVIDLKIMKRYYSNKLAKVKD